MSTTDVNTVVTDEDLEDELGEKEVATLVADADDGEQVRQLAFDDVLDQLLNRVPPIRETHLTTMSELKITIVHAACARLYRRNVTTSEGRSAAMAKHYQKEYLRRVRDLRPTITGLRLGAPAGIRVHRA